MAKAKKMATKNMNEINVRNPSYYMNREISWLEFNSRVLQEALDRRTPLLERLKFLSIFSSNLDEYFMVRVGGIKQQVDAEVNKLTPDGGTPQEQLDAISRKLPSMVEKQHEYFRQTIRPELANHGIYILDYIDLNQEQRNHLDKYFEEQVFPVLTPLAVDPSHPFPYMSNLSLNLAVVVKDLKTEKELFARVKVPEIFPRFLALPPELCVQQEGNLAVWMGIPLEQLIGHNLEFLFPEMNIQECHAFRITRDADLAVEGEEGDDLLLTIEQGLRKRRIGGNPVRLEVSATMPIPLLQMIIEELELEEQDVYAVQGLMALKDLMSFMSLPLPELKDPVWNPTTHPRLKNLGKLIINGVEMGGSLQSTGPGNAIVEDGDNIFTVIRQQDLLLHHPYQSFSSSVERFITEAAYDPQVLAIKMTLYRTSGDSPIVNALIAAAENGKQVAVLVELKARFDEENNINWARKLEQVGVHVVYGLVGLKTHTKVVLVVRREEHGIRRYVHIGTGNYNSKTAKLYTDLGLLSCRQDLGADLTDLFNYLTGHSGQQSYRKLLIAPVSMRDRFIDLIRREIEHCHNGNIGRIVAKMNALVDPEIIATLYEASQAGVKIDLIIRGICCLKPGLKDVSENIKVISIIGRYLEHSRIFYFYNNGKEEVFIGSADWMQRNLNRRVEAVTPVEDKELSKDLQEILGIMLSDNRQAWDMQSDGSYIQRHPNSHGGELSAQKLLMRKD